MAVLPGVLGCRTLRRTVQVRLGTNTLRFPGGPPILFALAALRSVPQAGSQLRGLATAIHDISGLKSWRYWVDRQEVYFAMRHEDFHPHPNPPPSPLKRDLRQREGIFRFPDGHKLVHALEENR